MLQINHLICLESRVFVKILKRRTAGVFVKKKQQQIYTATVSRSNVDLLRQCLLLFLFFSQKLRQCVFSRDVNLH